jgi:hypothetical protein
MRMYDLSLYHTPKIGDFRSIITIFTLQAPQQESINPLETTTHNYDTSN